MYGYVGHENEYLCNFPATKADLLDSVGYQIKSGGVVVVARTTAGIFENGYGSYGMKLTHAAPFSGTIIWDTGDADIRRASEEINIVPVPATDITGLSAAVADIPLNPLLTTDSRLDYLDAAVSTAGGGTVTVDLTPVLAELANPVYGLAANMALLEDADAEVDVIHDAIGSLGAALSSGLATETTQLEILTLLTIPDYVGPVIPAIATPQPGLQVLYGFVASPSGEMLTGITVEAELDGVNRVENEFLAGQLLASVTDANGQFGLILVQGCKYIVKIPRHGKEYRITVTSEATATLASYIPGGA